MKSNNKQNLLICGDNLNALGDLKKQGIKVDLIYLDPPFFSNRHYEVVWGDEAEVRSFKDRWAGGINVYIEWMKERVVKMYDILKNTGSFYLHCDYHAGHYLKVMLDEIFGYRNFRNEIVWWYITTPAPKKSFARQHDIILFYSKSKDVIFYRDNVRVPYSEETLSKKASRRVFHHSKKSYQQVPHKLGKVCPDVWQIPFINPFAHERLGYPTQKPETVLERVLKASSKENDLILDPFCGCGTAMAVAHRLKRKWIGVDISPTAVSLIEKRLEKLGAIKDKDFCSIGMPTTVTELKKLEPFEFQNWVVNEMQAKQSPRKTGDMGIDGHIEKSLYTEEAGIQVKQSEKKIGRIVIDNFKSALQRKSYEKGYVVGFDFTRDAHEEVARVKERSGLYIKLIKVEDLLKRKTGLLK